MWVFYISLFTFAFEEEGRQDCGCFTLTITLGFGDGGEEECRYPGRAGLCLLGIVGRMVIGWDIIDWGVRAWGGHGYVDACSYIW